MRRRGFTIIELLTVMAITAILMTLIILPVFQSFNLTRAAQAFSDAQEKARLLTERIGREVSNAASVRENRGSAGSVFAVVPGQNGDAEAVLLPWAKLDLVKPAEGDPTRVNGAFINPVTGKADPTLRAPKGQIQLPVAPGMTLVRFFVGLREPLDADGNVRPYTNPYDGLLMQKSGERDNLYVLYRAEIPVYDFNTQALTDEDNNGVPDFFVPDANGAPSDIDDPAFFTFLPGADFNYVTRTLTTQGQAKAVRIANWKRRSQIMTEVSRYDMILPVYNRANRQVVYDGNQPRLLPLLQMRPSRVDAEPVKAMTASRLGEEADSDGDVPPATYRTKYGLWSSGSIRTLPSGWDPTVAAINDFQIGRLTESAGHLGFSFFYFDPDVHIDEALDGLETYRGLFYDQAQANGDRNPFSQAVNGAALSNIRARETFAPYRVMRNTGELKTDFGIEEVGDAPGDLPGNLEDPLGDRSNLPFAIAGPALSPTNDTGLATGTFSDAQFDNINRRFNKIWNDFPALRPEIHRYIDLRVTPNEDGAPSPLHPTQGFARARIVPGSEVVWGPDQLPGPNFGREIRYARTTRKPGPNQYRINYVNLAEPTDYALLGLPNPPAVYDSTNFVSAVIQPRYRAGYLELNSDPNNPLPATMGAIRATDGQLVAVPGRIRVSYRFTFASQQDIVSVDYDSRQLMSILLTIRNYPQSNIPNPQTVTLKATAKVRNFIR